MAWEPSAIAGGALDGSIRFQTFDTDSSSSLAEFVDVLSIGVLEDASLVPRQSDVNFSTAATGFLQEMMDVASDGIPDNLFPFASLSSLDLSTPMSAVTNAVPDNLNPTANPGQFNVDFSVTADPIDVLLNGVPDVFRDSDVIPQQSSSAPDVEPSGLNGLPDLAAFDVSAIARDLQAFAGHLVPYPTWPIPDMAALGNVTARLGLGEIADLPDISLMSVSSSWVGDALDPSSPQWQWHKLCHQYRDVKARQHSTMNDISRYIRQWNTVLLEAEEYFETRGVMLQPRLQAAATRVTRFVDLLTVLVLRRRQQLLPGN